MALLEGAILPRLSREVTTHLAKARDSAFLAVETYNRPQSHFRSGAYIVLMCIAWTALFHAIFFKRKVKPFYRQKKHRGRYEILDGDKKAWELSTCIDKYWSSVNSPVKSNLVFFVGLRNKIEHRSMPELDIRIFGECQAMLFNFEDILASEFGPRYAINDSVSLALQFSRTRSAEQDRSIRTLHSFAARKIASYIDMFRSSLGTEEAQDSRFSYKVFLIPKPANHQGSADLAVEFVKFDPNNASEMERIDKIVSLIKPVPGPPSKIAIDVNAAVDERALAVKLTTDPSAPVVRAFSPDDTHPYRQKDLLEQLKGRLTLPITTHDLLCVRTVHNITDRADFYYKGKFGSSQYSQDYADWIVEQATVEDEFFEECRASYRTRSA